MLTCGVQDDLFCFNKLGDCTRDVFDQMVRNDDGDRLAENWIFIDMLHFLNMQGFDVLRRMKKR